MTDDLIINPKNNNEFDNISNHVSISIKTNNRDVSIDPISNNSKKMYYQKFNNSPLQSNLDYRKKYKNKNNIREKNILNDNDYLKICTSNKEYLNESSGSHLVNQTNYENFILN